MRKCFFLILFCLNIVVFGQQKSLIKMSPEVSLCVEIENFNVKKHLIEHCEVFCKDYCVIDNHISFGLDCEPPYTQLNLLQFIFQGKEINLDVTGMYNPNLRKLNISKNQFELFSHGKGQFHILKGIFSDGAGTYTAQWLIKKNYSVRTNISPIE